MACIPFVLRAGVVIPHPSLESPKEFVFTFNAKDKKWNLPGGKLDRYVKGTQIPEGFEETAIREVEEETGLIVKLQGILPAISFYRNHRDVLMLGIPYLARIVGGKLEPLDRGRHPKVEAFTYAQLQEMVEQGKIREPTNVYMDPINLYRRKADKLLPLDTIKSHFHSESAIAQ